MPTTLTSQHRLIISTLALIATAIFSAYLFSGWLALLITAALCIGLWLFRPLLLPPGYGKNRVRTLSVLGVFALASSHGYWQEFVNAFAAALATDPRVRAVAPWIGNIHLHTEPSTAVLVFVIAALWIIHRHMSDNTIAGNHPTPLSTAFPDHSFDAKLASFCLSLRQNLLAIDRETNWSPEYYAHIEAEIEIVPDAGGRESKRLTDLQHALRADPKSQCFLILGEPGSGKSVALRKLARDMLNEVGPSGRVPIYINLREWLPREGRRHGQWTEHQPPTIKELEDFIVDNIKSRGDIFVEQFVDSHFRELWEHGRLFFIFDSFDEIPELLDVNEESWLLNSLSDLISRFLSGSAMSRGALASRFFRRPTQSFLAQKVLEIRPLSEEQVLQALSRFPVFNDALKAALFRDRIDLVPIVRNPFLMTLLGEWVSAFGSLPNTQIELFENYLHGRLSKCSERIKQAGLTIEQVFQGAAEIAWFVFESPAYGLEAPVQVIERESAAHARAVMEILSYARVARVTLVEPQSFAFVHRRFLEYFVTTRLLKNPAEVPAEHIPTDSRGRDALVLFAQLCGDESAQRLAQLCWDEIQRHFDSPDTRLRGIHSLRFLTEAFRTRRQALVAFSDDLRAFIDERTTAEANLLSAKICLEGTGLFSAYDAAPIVIRALSGRNIWLRDTAFRACRLMPQIPKELEQQAVQYIAFMPLREFWRSRRSLLLSLSLTETLRGVYQVARLRQINLLISAIAAVLAISISPYVLFLAAFVVTVLLTELLFISAALEFGSYFRKKLGLSDKTGHRSFEDRLLGLFPIGFFSNVEWMRFVLATCAMLSGLLFLYRLPPYGLDSSFPLNLTAWGFIKYLPVSGYLMLPLGLLMLEWLAVGQLCRAAARMFSGFTARSLTTYVLVLTASLAILAGMGWTVVWLVSLLGEQWRLLFIVPGAIFAAAALIFQLTGKLAGRMRDKATLSQIVINTYMSRVDIAEAFSQLRTVDARLSLVRSLAQRKVQATGDWPGNFRLVVSADASYVELARLEERWLKLDR